MTEPTRAVRAVLFDLDGTLVDSEPNYLEADRLLLADYGGAFPADLTRRYVGYGNAAMREEFHERFRRPDGPGRLLAKKNALYLDLARRNTPLFPEMARLLPELKGRGISLAVASGSSPAVIEEIVAQVGISAYFDLLLSSEEVARPKPAPDIFLEAARRLGCPPSSALVVEDSAHGVEAALAAGMAVVAVPTLAPSRGDVFHRAHRLFEGGMDDFTARAFLEWLDGADR